MTRGDRAAVTDTLIAALKDRGLRPSVVEREGESVIQVDGADLGEVESLLAELELPLVPEQGDGQVFIRQPTA